ncbi:MAG: hypothetical protein PVF26_13985 [Desulfobacterales bacterium]|jgi:hypothetical protein
MRIFLVFNYISLVQNPGIILLQDPAFALLDMQHVLMLPVILASGD